MIYHRICNKRNTTVPHVEQELLTLPEPQSPSPLLVVFVLLVISFLCNALQITVCPFSFGHCTVFPSQIYGLFQITSVVSSNFFQIVINTKQHPTAIYQFLQQEYRNMGWDPRNNIQRLYTSFFNRNIETWVGIPISSLTSPHVCVCSKPGPGFLTSYVVVVLIFSERWLSVLLILVESLAITV